MIILLYYGLGLLCLTLVLTIVQLYRGVSLIWWRKPEYQEKTTDLSQVTDKLYHICILELFRQCAICCHPSNPFLIFEHLPS